MVVRFADDDEDVASAVAITVEDGRPSDGTARRGSSAHRRVASLDEDAAQTPTEPDDGPLHLGGLQMLRDDMQDYGYGHSGAESEGDGPLDGGMQRSLGTVSAGDGPLLGGAQQHHASGMGGVEGPVLLGPGGERVPVGVVPSGRRHHRAPSGRPGKGGNKQSKSAVMRTWLRIDKNGETSILQVGRKGPKGRGGRGSGGCSVAGGSYKQGTARCPTLGQRAVRCVYGPRAAVQSGWCGSRWHGSDGSTLCLQGILGICGTRDLRYKTDAWVRYRSRLSGTGLEAMG